MRKKNEQVFGKYVENSAYRIDFDELGEIVYEHSSGFRTWRILSAEFPDSLKHAKPFAP